jgi:hypothetical protein
MRIRMVAERDSVTVGKIARVPHAWHAASPTEAGEAGMLQLSGRKSGTLR